MRAFRFSSVLLCAVLCAFVSAPEAAACTNILVTKGASKTGSTLLTYSVDGPFHPSLRFTPAKDHAPGATLDITDWNGKVRRQIPQPSHTYATFGIMNEHQLAIGETTFDGRPELENPDGAFPYWTLMEVTLQRARTAREAIKVMTDLVAEFGYSSTGESFSIIDPNEAWILEMIGPGKGGHGAHWVAVRVPDGAIAAHANRARIGVFPLKDPGTCLYSPDVVSFARSKGYYDPKRDGAFSFCEAYCPATAQELRYTETRVWSVFRRAAPSQAFSPDYHRGVPGAARYPLWITPDHKLDAADVVALMRDHYEGTPYDMTKGVDAGPFGSPYRARPMAFKVGDKAYTWERPISTPQTACSYLAECRSWLPDAIGGVLWYGLDDTYTTCYFPLYAGISAVPPSCAGGSLNRFSWDGAYWVFNLVSNYAQLKYSHMVKDIQSVQKDLESSFFRFQPVFEKAALELYKTDPQAAGQILTDYSVTSGEMVVKRWRQLGESLFARYNDGYVQDAKGRSRELGYPEDWLREVLRAKPTAFQLPEKDRVVHPESY